MSIHAVIPLLVHSESATWSVPKWNLDDDGSWHGKPFLCATEVVNRSLEFEAFWRTIAHYKLNIESSLLCLTDIKITKGLKKKTDFLCCTFCHPGGRRSHVRRNVNGDDHQCHCHEVSNYFIHDIRNVFLSINRRILLKLPKWFEWPRISSMI